MTFADFCTEHRDTISSMIKKGKFSAEKLEILSLVGFKVEEDNE